MDKYEMLEKIKDQINTNKMKENNILAKKQEQLLNLFLAW